MFDTNLKKLTGTLAIVVTLLITATACSEKSSPLSPEESTLLLTVTPAGDSELVDPNSPIVLTFDRRMDPALCEPQVLLYEGDRSGSLVEVTYAWSEDGIQLTVTPGTPLKSQTTYTLYVGGGLADGSGMNADLSQAQNRFGGRWVEENPTNGIGPNGECETPQAQGFQHGHQHRSRQMGLIFIFTTA